MSALTRLERLDDLFPEMFRRFTQPMRLADDAPADAEGAPVAEGADVSAGEPA